MTNYQINILVFIQTMDKSFGCENGWMGKLVRLVPVPVQILTELKKKFVIFTKFLLYCHRHRRRQNCKITEIYFDIYDVIQTHWFICVKFQKKSVSFIGLCLFFDPYSSMLGSLHLKGSDQQKG